MYKKIVHEFQKEVTCEKCSRGLKNCTGFQIEVTCQKMFTTLKNCRWIPKRDMDLENVYEVQKYPFIDYLKMVTRYKNYSHVKKILTWIQK